MNIDSHFHYDPFGRYLGRRLGIVVPLHPDYTEAELAYAQEELVRVTYLSMYKIIDTIGQRREDESQRLRKAQQEEERRQAGERQAREAADIEARNLYAFPRTSGGQCRDSFCAFCYPGP